MTAAAAAAGVLRAVTAARVFAGVVCDWRSFTICSGSSAPPLQAPWEGAAQRTGAPGVTGPGVVLLVTVLSQEA